MITTPTGTPRRQFTASPQWGLSPIPMMTGWSPFRKHIPRGAAVNHMITPPTQLRHRRRRVNESMDTFEPQEEYGKKREAPTPPRRISVRQKKHGNFRTANIMSPVRSYGPKFDESYDKDL